MTDTHNHGDPVTFAERLMRLCGESTYRMPVEGRSTRPGNLPAAHQLAAALGMARRLIQQADGTRTPHPNDVGPDILFDIVVRQTANATRVVRTIAGAMAADRNRAAKRCEPYLGIVVWAAYAQVVYGLQQPQLRPGEVTPADWDLLTHAAERIMLTLADDALARAERTFHANAA